MISENLIKTIIVSKKPLELRYECLSTKLNYTTLGEAACKFKNLVKILNKANSKNSNLS